MAQSAVSNKATYQKLRSPTRNIPGKIVPSLLKTRNTDLYISHYLATFREIREQTFTTYNYFRADLWTLFGEECRNRPGMAGGASETTRAVAKNRT